MTDEQWNKALTRVAGDKYWQGVAEGIAITLIVLLVLAWTVQL